VPSIWSRPSTVQGPAISANWLGGRELVGLEDRYDLIDPGVALQPEAGDMVAVADGADDGHQLSLRDVGPGAHALHAAHDRGDLLLGRRRFHHDHHAVLSFRKAWKS
jgi:hypothetical protein